MAHHYPDPPVFPWPAGFVYWSMLGHFRRICHEDRYDSEPVQDTWNGKLV